MSAHKKSTSSQLKNNTHTIAPASQPTSTPQSGCDFVPGGVRVRAGAVLFSPSNIRAFRSFLGSRLLGPTTAQATATPVLLQQSCAAREAGSGQAWPLEAAFPLGSPAQAVH